MPSRETVQIPRRIIVPHNEGHYYVAYAIATAIYVGYGLLLLVRWSRVKAKLPGNDE
jgi:hypothetical protein